ncbi:MAG: carnitine 3-dehydrogenase [Pseudomonadota bacterium]
MSTTDGQIAAIIGGGVIGGGWAARFLLMGWDVVVFDPAPDAERKVSEVSANARRSLPGLSEVALPDEGSIRFAATIGDAVQSADWVQESVPERLDLKHETLNEIQAACRPDAIVGSSTSGFKPSELQKGSHRPNQIIVAHPFNPVYLLPLVELVGDQTTVTSATDILTHIGMKPLHVRKEIDAHIADRLLEAVWREALWLVKDDIATTGEIDDAIRFGFGLRWAQMGLFDTYRVAGGEAGMSHFICQFGPALQWPWTKLMDVPDLTPELVEKIATQSDNQSAQYSVRELERIRDDNLVAMMRALKARNWGVGSLLNELDGRMKPVAAPVAGQPITTIERSVPSDWTDYNGHMNESRYGQLLSDAADEIMQLVGADADYVAAGNSYFTVDTNIQYLHETHAGERVTVKTTIREGFGKKLRLRHDIFSANGNHLAIGEQLLIHVSLETRRSSEPLPDVAAKVASLATSHPFIPND